MSDKPVSQVSPEVPRPLPLWKWLIVASAGLDFLVAAVCLIYFTLPAALELVAWIAAWIKVLAGGEVPWVTTCAVGVAVFVGVLGVRGVVRHRAKTDELPFVLSCVTVTLAFGIPILVSGMAILAFVLGAGVVFLLFGIMKLWSLRPRMDDVRTIVMFGSIGFLCVSTGVGVFGIEQLRELMAERFSIRVPETILLAAAMAPAALGIACAIACWRISSFHGKQAHLRTAAGRPREPVPVDFTLGEEAEDEPWTPEGEETERK